MYMPMSSDYGDNFGKMNGWKKSFKMNIISLPTFYHLYKGSQFKLKFYSHFMR